MHRRKCVWLIWMIVGCFPASGWAQSAINPDISFIGDMRYLYRDGVASALAGQERTSFEFEELEINMSGYLNPYARADLFMAVHGVEGPFELEEAYASVLRGLPAQFKFGKYLLDFGKLNTMHQHQWSWQQTPLVLGSFFGEEGAGVIGLQASRLEAVGDIAVTVSANAFRSDFFGLHGEEHGDDHGHEGKSKIGYSGHVSLYRDVAETSGIEFGGSYLYAEYDPESGLETHVAGVDLTYKWRPDAYNGFKINAEAMLSDRETTDPADSTAVRDVTAVGAFANAELRFRKRFDVGAYFDWAEDAFDSNLEATGAGVYFGFMPVEESTRFSLLYRHEVADTYDGASNTVAFQVLWSLGPHKPHKF